MLEGQGAMHHVEGGSMHGVVALRLTAWMDAPDATGVGCYASCRRGVYAWCDGSQADGLDGCVRTLVALAEYILIHVLLQPFH